MGGGAAYLWNPGDLMRGIWFAPLMAYGVLVFAFTFLFQVVASFVGPFFGGLIGWMNPRVDLGVFGDLVVPLTREVDLNVNWQYGGGDWYSDIYFPVPSYTFWGLGLALRRSFSASRRRISSRRRRPPTR